MGGGLIELNLDFKRVFRGIGDFWFKCNICKNVVKIWGRIEEKEKV